MGTFDFSNNEKPFIRYLFNIFPNISFMGDYLQVNSTSYNILHY